MFGERVSAAFLRVSCCRFVRSLLVLFILGLLSCLHCMDSHGLLSCLLGLSLPGTRTWLPDCHYMIRPAYRLVPSLHRPSGCSPGPVRPPNISFGPVHARSALLLALSYPCLAAILLALPCPCTVRPTSRLVLSLHGPCSCSPCPVPAQSAQHLVGSCPCTVCSTSRRVLSLHGPRSCSSGLVLSLHGPSGCSSGPIPVPSALLLV